MSKPTEVYACLYAKEFPAQALLRLRPELREKACAVMDGEPSLQEVCSLTKTARGLGMVHGMTQVEVETFAQVMVLRRSEKEEAATRQVLLECAGGFSPRVEDRSENGAFLCVIDIAGNEGTLRSVADAGAEPSGAVRALGITACVAVSGNFHAAVAVAKAPLPLSGESHSTGEESTALAALPLTVLDLGESSPGRFRCGGFAPWECLPRCRKKNSSPAWDNRQAASPDGARRDAPLVSAEGAGLRTHRAHGTGLAHQSARCVDVCRECVAGTDDSPCDSARGWRWLLSPSLSR